MTTPCHLVLSLPLPCLPRDCPFYEMAMDTCCASGTVGVGAGATGVDLRTFSFSGSLPPGGEETETVKN